MGQGANVIPFTTGIHRELVSAEREAMALHSALAEACKRINTLNKSSRRKLPYKDLLAVLEAPATAPRPWEPQPG